MLSSFSTRELTNKELITLEKERVAEKEREVKKEEKEEEEPERKFTSTDLIPCTF